VCAAATLHADDTGALSGQVRYVGRVPPPVIVVESGRDQHVLEVEPGTKGLAFAVVYVDAEPEPPLEPLAAVTIDQAGWIFRPPVVAVRAGQLVRFANSDGANHNVRSQDEVAANRMNAQTLNTPHVHRFQPKPAPGSPVAITCDIHPWMIAWVYVFEHRFFAATAADGRFRIDSLPPGPRRLHVRHPAGGLARDLYVVVAAGHTTVVDVSFDTPDLSPWDPSWPSQASVQTRSVPVKLIERIAKLRAEEAPNARR
jgi:plastocyanin